MRYGSVCSGIESASVAWTPLGWIPAWFSEVDPFASAVLAERYPGVKNIGDMRGIGEQHGPVDVLVGGPPCQPWSLTGKRQGLDDDRGDLTLLYAKLLGVLRPRWFVLENVPGFVSSDGQSVFRRFLDIAVNECGFGVSWRVLDCKGFGIPQRRRRLFVVGHSGGQWRRAGAVLLDARGYRKDVRSTPKVRGSASGASSPGSVRHPAVGWTGDPTPKFEVETTPTLRANQGGEIAGFARSGVARRFTAIEWERLMGLPDNYTAVTFKGKPASYKQRITAIGNSFPVPMLKWIGERIAFIEEFIDASA